MVLPRRLSIPVIMRVNRKSIIIFIASLVLLQANAVEYTFKVINFPSDTQLFIYWPASDKKMVLSSHDNIITIDTCLTFPQYIDINCGKALKGTAFLSPKENLIVEIDMKGKRFVCKGQLRDINDYLLNSDFGSLSFTVAKGDELDYISLCDSLYKRNLYLLKQRKLPSYFNGMETERLRYQSFSGLPLYPKYHKYLNELECFVPSCVYYNKLNELLVFDKSLMTNSDYLNFLKEAVNTKSTSLSGKIDDNAFIAYFDTVSMDSGIRSMLIHNHVVSLIKKNGIDEKEALIRFYRNQVKNVDYITAFDELYVKWEALGVGKPSPSFSCSDIEGKTVALESLRGKYVYIDVWATWCGPCRGEMPHLKKLEEKYHGKDIHFVSLSCDQNKAAWENMVKKDAMKGIQLYLGAGSDFMDKYMINGIPRFILLDRDGNIVKANAPRPSNPETAQLFDELLAK